MAPVSAIAFDEGGGITVDCAKFSFSLLLFSAIPRSQDPIQKQFLVLPPFMLANVASYWWPSAL